MRKFTKTPWTPIQLLSLGTLSPEMLAYFWMLMQYKMNVLITGETSSGKTTLLNHMIGLLTPFSGDILIQKKSISHTPEHERLSILRKIGVLYQSGALFGSINLLKNIALPLEELTELPPDAILEIAHDKLKMVGLENFADFMPAEISGGMQKRAAIARAMALDPKILFLDEPTSGLDPISSSEIDQLIVNLSGILGITFVIVSHDLSSIYKIAKRVILLYKGKIIGEGHPKELRDSKHPFIKQFFARKAVD
ncbi:MAG: Flp pilus assembly complex ATPase component TadA [Gammaproteobacteria bacterium]|nr:Flp pilus assembly complex ATPase component TadA [Gammaproteobacteria bacterium]